MSRRLAYDAAERAARESYGKLLAYLAARSADVALAEDALADAFTSALERWPLETFGAGWDDPAAAAPRVRGLTSEALWLGRLVVDVAPNDPEALGLLAMMLHADARRIPAGDYVPFGAQDPRRWNGAQIDEAESLLCRAAGLRRPGRFQLEAAIQSAYAERRFRGEPAWDHVVRLL